MGTRRQRREGEKRARAEWEAGKRRRERQEVEKSGKPAGAGQSSPSGVGGKRADGLDVRR